MARNPRFMWERRIASAEGPKSPTTRHVLLTIGTHSDIGGCAWPSIRKLAVETALSDRAVLEHIALALEEGWLICEKRGNGKGWRLNVYQLAFPVDAGSARNPRDAVDGRSARSPTNRTTNRLPADGVDPGAHGADLRVDGVDPDGYLVFTDGHTNNGMISTKNNKKSTTTEKPFFSSSDEQPTNPTQGNGNGAAEGNAQAQQQTASSEKREPHSIVEWADYLGITRRVSEHPGEFQLRVMKAREEHLRAGTTPSGAA